MRQNSIAAIIAAYKKRHSPYTARPDYRHYLLGLASELAESTNEHLSLAVGDRWFQHYVYVYLNPLKPGVYRYVCPSGKVVTFTYEPFYVGKGFRHRAFDHLNEASRSDTRNHKLNTIRKIRKATGGEPLIRIIPSRISDSMAKALEIDLIAGIGRRDQTKGPLANLTDGGDGNAGAIRSLDYRKRASEIRSGVPLSKEHKENIRRSFDLMTAEEKTRRRNNQLKAWYSRSPEAEAARLTKLSLAYTGKAEEEKERIKKKSAESNKATRASWGEEKRASVSRAISEGLKSLPRADKVSANKKRALTRRKWDADTREQVRLKQNKTRLGNAASHTEAHKAHICEVRRLVEHNLAPEVKLERSRKQKAAKASMTPEQRAERLRRFQETWSRKREAKQEVL